MAYRAYVLISVETTRLLILAAIFCAARREQSLNLFSAYLSGVRKILAQLSKGSKPSKDTLTKLITSQFDEMLA